MYVISNGEKTAVILQDTQAESPREPGYQTNLTKMVCWHRRYNLGDKHNFDDAQEFAESLANEYLTIQDVFKGIRDGLVEGYQLAEVESFFCNGKEYGPSYCLEVYSGLRGDEGWHGTDWFVTQDLEFITSRGQSLEDLFEVFTTRDLLKLLDASDKVAIKTLYLYDHSGLSISTGSFVGKAHQADWDSGPVGFIYMDKETVMKNMAMPKETLRIGKFFSEGERDTVFFKLSRDFDPMDISDYLEKKGYERVKNASLIRNLNDSRLLSAGEKQSFDAADVNAGFVFKKDNCLYRSSGVYGASPYQSVKLTAVASFNPDLQPMTAEAWKAAAMRELDADTKEYDNYLAGEVYGYRCFEGLDEVDSCWGFNPGAEDIKELMSNELRGWFGSKMEFEYEPGENFDIEEYFEENDFPKLRELIAADVKEFVVFESKTSEIYPFDMSADDIVANKDGVLDKIVQALYEKHYEPSTDDVYDAVEEHAGVSRVLKPRIKAADLDPNRDYTAEEIMALINAKAPLDDIIRSCEAANKKQPVRDDNDFTPERDDDR